MLKEAIQMDIDDINKIAAKSNDPDKYKCPVQELQEYVKTLDPNEFK